MKVHSLFTYLFIHKRSSMQPRSTNETTWNAVKQLFDSYHPEVKEWMKAVDETSQIPILLQVSTVGANALMLAALLQPTAVAPLCALIQTLDAKDQAQILLQVSKDGVNALMLAARYQPTAVAPLCALIQTLDAKDQAQILLQVSKDGWNALMLAAL